MSIVRDVTARTLRRARTVAGPRIEQSLRRAMGMTTTPSLGEIYDRFTTTDGVDLALHEDLRSQLKPHWRSVVDSQASDFDVDTGDVVGPARRSVATMRSMLRACGWNGSHGDVVEIGCAFGNRAFAMAESGFTVTALDLPRYYVRNGAPANDESALADVVDHLARARASVGAAFEGDVQASVSFVDDDVCTAPLSPSSADLVVSWEVLEHVRDIGEVLAAVRRILRPGGYLFSEYNPFFSRAGGHSLCTLDIPFGHARLSRSDFERYVRAHRPEEADQDLDFYDNALNRMTLCDLEDACRQAGMDVVALLPAPDVGDLALLDESTLAAIQRNHPTARLEDLLCSVVHLVARAP